MYDDAYAGVLTMLASYREDLSKISVDKQAPHEPHWRSPLLFGIDGASLYGFTRDRAPSHYVEIGSGDSTLFVDRARRDGSIALTITSIDPEPRREVDAICDRVLREPLELVNLDDAFSGLEAGDMVFLDGTHRVFMNSDVTVFFLDVLPKLPSGVLVGIHDVHLPDDYPPVAVNKFYSEQYLLAGYLLAEGAWVRPVLPCWYVSRHPTLGPLVGAVLPAEVDNAAPASPRAEQHPEGVIFWLEIRRDASSAASSERR